MQLKHRQEYLETDYINGVKNENGKMVIRPLNEEEKDWLNRFYEETLSCSKIDENDFYEDKKAFYKEDYLRKNDIFNISNMLGNLEEIDYSTIEKMALQGASFEDLIIEILDIKIKREGWKK